MDGLISMYTNTFFMAFVCNKYGFFLLKITMLEASLAYGDNFYRCGCTIVIYKMGSVKKCYN